MLPKKHHHHQVFDISIDVLPHQNTSKCFNGDGRLKRTELWTASPHNNSCDWFWSLSLAWAIAQLGWIAGPAVMFLFSFVIYYTSSLLADCYRSGDPVSGKRNYTYMDAI
ncbi:Amino acid permease 2 [Vitis vinifera]|uniref:Amino acid permease 2 n=1 Tax=Vitis vinifera TaxID=29760 RepID=A0A438CPW3_VITVI|nr:Amino acid permease 2 [Vitis vinifera]